MLNSFDPTRVYILLEQLKPGKQAAYCRYEFLKKTYLIQVNEIGPFELSLAGQKERFDLFRREIIAHDFFCDIHIERFAGENIDIGVADLFRKVAGNGAGLDQLDERIAGGMGIMSREVGQCRLAIGFHVDRGNQFFDESNDIRAVFQFFRIASFAI